MCLLLLLPFQHFVLRFLLLDVVHPPAQAGDDVFELVCVIGEHLFGVLVLGVQRVRLHVPGRPLESGQGVVQFLSNGHFHGCILFWLGKFYTPITLPGKEPFYQ